MSDKSSLDLLFLLFLLPTLLIFVYNILMLLFNRFDDLLMTTTMIGQTMHTFLLGYFGLLSEFIAHLVRASRAKMSIIHEKDIQLSQNEGRVYPKVQKLPNPLCCFKVMHIRTGTLWIAYCEIMWIVTQFAFWTAESIVRGAFQPYIIISGFSFTFIQLILTILLIQGTQKFRLAYIELYMIGVCCRLFLFSSFFLTFLFFFIVDGDFYKTEQEPTFFHHHLPLKIGFTALYAILKMYALYTAYRCYSYISRTRRTLLQLTVFNDLEKLVADERGTRMTLTTDFCGKWIEL